MRIRALADFELAKTQLTEWLRDRGVLEPGGHLYDHGHVNDRPEDTIYLCSPCLVFFPVSDTRPNSCPKCGQLGQPRPCSGPPEPGDVCQYPRGNGSCGYRMSCETCGAAAVLCDLELALDDLAARAYAIPLVHELEKASAALGRARVEATRERITREFEPKVSSAMTEYIQGRANHLEQTRAKVQAGYERIRAGGRTPTVIEPRATETSEEDILQRVCETGRPFGFANPRASVRTPRIDPDRELLGSLQGHLRVHGFSYSDIAIVMPDGAGGTSQQQRRRVEDRLRKRRRS